ncbi:MAG: hypothetical protein ACFFDI_17235 [Promethearchaeota archaeon]
MQIRGVSQPEKFGRDGNFINSERAQICIKRTQERPKGLGQHLPNDSARLGAV